MNILLIGDVVGRVGRNMLKKYLLGIKKEYQVDFVIANGENATHGKGLSSKHHNELVNYGVNAITMGNHYFRVGEILTNNDRYTNLIRPYNFFPSVPGKGTRVFKLNDTSIRVTNLIGRVGIQGADSNPFDCLKNIIEKEEATDIHIVDFHAEMTGEKNALAYAFDGKISALFGTHTHIQTNDARYLPKGTLYISDVGMCGAQDSILGVQPKEVIERCWRGYADSFKTPSEGKGILNSLLISIENKKVVSFKYINIIE